MTEAWASRWTQRIGSSGKAKKCIPNISHIKREEKRKGEERGERGEGEGRGGEERGGERGLE